MRFPLRRILAIALLAAPALAQLGCAGAGFSVLGTMSRDGTPLVLTGSECEYVPKGEWSLRTTTAMAGASLEARGRARLWIAGGETSLAISNTDPDSLAGGIDRRTFWSAGFEVGRGPAAPPGAFVRLRASWLEAPEDPSTIRTPHGWQTYDASLKRSSAAVLVGRSAPRGRAYCGLRVSSVEAYTLLNVYAYHLAAESDLGVVVGVEGEGEGAAVFLEAGFLDSTGVELGVRWSR